MLNLREQVEKDLSITLEGSYGLPIDLISPDGETETVSGQVLYDWQRLNPDTGDEETVREPVITVRLSSLTRVPLPGETWGIKIPVTPEETAERELYVINSDRAPEGSASIGFIRLYLQKAQQIEI